MLTGTKEQRTELFSCLSLWGTVERGNLEEHSAQLEALNEMRVAMSSTAALVGQGESLARTPSQNTKPFLAQSYI